MKNMKPVTLSIFILLSISLSAQRETRPEINNITISTQNYKLKIPIYEVNLDKLSLQNNINTYNKTILNTHNNNNYYLCVNPNINIEENINLSIDFPLKSELLLNSYNFKGRNNFHSSTKNSFNPNGASTIKEAFVYGCLGLLFK